MESFQSNISNNTEFMEINKNDNEDEKRLRRLMRNREAAKRYFGSNHRNRLKKKDWINGLQKSNDAQREANDLLKKKIMTLREEYARLQILIDAQNRRTELTRF